MRDEVALVAAAQQGDREAFSALLSGHASAILSVAWRIVGNRAEAEDIAQETFLAAFQALPAFRVESRFSTWLYRIAVNKCRDRLRARGREMEEDEADEQAGTSLDHRSPEAFLLDKQRAACLERAIASLAPLYREAFVLRHVEGLSYDEMSSATGADGSTLRMRVYKARVELARKLAAVLGP